MKILLTGSSGFLGSAINHYLTAKGHTIIPLSRNNKTANGSTWQPVQKQIDLKNKTDIDCVIHLAGANIANSRWSKTKQALILNSRVQSTQLLANYFARSKYKPKVIISASAIGFYGNRNADILDETSHSGDGFLADVCQKWEAATAPALEAGIRVVNIRLGLVLAASGGMLKKMLLPFKLGLGGQIGNGEHYMSWIDLDDVLGAIEHIMNEKTIHGPVNLVAPKPVKNSLFTKLLGKALHRPALLPIPAVIIKIILGKMGKELLLASTFVTPAKLLESGYHFHHSDLEETFHNLFSP